jgi:thymidylate synthase ThyX
MEVILAGFNLDRQLVASLAAVRPPAVAPGPSGAAPAPSPFDPALLTPETLSAAYARISRDPRPIPELRADACADVARARRSNEQIVFGFGHASVAEHAVFNFDILGLSRLAVEALEATRLGSYTEKSQRYILLERDFIVPAEVRGTPLESGFRELLARQQQGYRHAYETLMAHYARTQPEAWADPKARRELEGSAREDARYFLGLATTGQLGATMNARVLEATIRRLMADPIDEARELGLRLHGAVIDVAPSLVRHTDATPYRQDTPCALRDLARRLIGARAEAVKPHATGSGATDPHATAARPTGEAPAAKLVAISSDAESDLIAALLHGCGGIAWDEARAVADGLSDAQRREVVLESLRRIGQYETPLRAFELPGFTFELIVSASCFAQLKRHRMATLLPQPYAPELGVTEPDAFAAAGISQGYAEVCRSAETLYRELRELAPAAAAYALTNGHRRRVLFRANARELYHFASLRLDRHAQWDIRRVAEEMIRLARERMPLAMLLAAGKDRFTEARRAIETAD